MAFEIPAALVTAVSEQRAVLFLGAGASKGALHPRGDQIPSGTELRDMICDQFLGGKLKDHALSQATELAISETSIGHVQLFVAQVLKDFRAAPFHKLIPSFRWHAIVTTNLDLIIEDAYDQAPDRLQQLIPFYKNGQFVETEAKKYSFPLEYVKLHGCIAHAQDHDVPFILAAEQYAKWYQGRSRLFERMRDWGREFPFVFCGYSVSDPHIQAILFDLSDEKLNRPAYFAVAPDLDEIEARYWTRQRVIPIRTAFADFLGALDTAISKVQRTLPRTIAGGESSLSKHYRVSRPTESAQLQSFLCDDVDHVRSGMPINTQSPSDFYRGYDTGWGCIAQNLDAKRGVVETVLVDALLLEEEQRSSRVDFYVLKGPAGNGKTVSLKRIAWEAAYEFDKLVLFLKPGGSLRFEACREIHALTGKRTFVFVDRIALNHDDVRAFLRNCRAEALPVTVVGAERDNEWNIRCGDLDAYVSDEFPVRFLSEREIRELIELLETHRALGLLEQASPEERFDAFAKRAERQLLVALHETTLGRPFEEIVVDEYKGISPDEARLLYLDVCALNRLGVAVRAGLISRVSGIRFEDFKERFFAPLEHVLMARRDKYTGDMMYLARHQHVAELVFAQALAGPDERFDVLLRLLKGLNLDFTCDHLAFWQLVRGRVVADTFPSQELGRRFYNAAQEVARDDPHLLQQRAIFEMNHEGGSLELAKRYLESAAASLPHDPPIRHSQAVLYRKLALATSNTLLRRHCRQLALERLQSPTGEASHPYAYHTKALLLLDQLRDSLDELEARPDDELTQRRLVESTREAEAALQGGLQRFPDDSALQATESEFRDLIDQHDKAERALQKAFELNKRLDWIAVRLAQKSAAKGDLDGALKTLQECLNHNPGSKPAHLEMAKLLNAKGADRALILEHLRRSFTEGDTNFDAQFRFGRELFLASHHKEAARIFESLKHAPIEPKSRRKTRAWVRDADGSMTKYQGRVRRREATYVLIESSAFEPPIFGHVTGSQPRHFSSLLSGTKVEFNLGFSMEGPRAVALRPIP